MGSRRVAVRAGRSVDEAEALRLVAGGLSTSEAAAELGVSAGTVSGRVRRALGKLPDVDGVVYRRLLVAELERVKLRAWALVDDPPPVVSAGRVAVMVGEDGQSRLVRDGSVVNAALGTILKALERQSKLLGLDAPVRQTVQVVDNRAVEEAIADVERQLALMVEGSVDGEQGGGGG